MILTATHDAGTVVLTLDLQQIILSCGEAEHLAMALPRAISDARNWHYQKDIEAQTAAQRTAAEAELARTPGGWLVEIVDFRGPGTWLVSSLAEDGRLKHPSISALNHAPKDLWWRFPMQRTLHAWNEGRTACELRFSVWTHDKVYGLRDAHPKYPRCKKCLAYLEKCK